MKLIIGLGNIGKKYEKTRHNIGFMLLDDLSKDFKENKKFQALITKEKNILAKPTTLMNNSGLAAVKLKNFYKVKTSEIIVVHDDKDLPFGKLRIRKNGSSGGHNGVESIIKNLKSANFTRLKIGIANQDIRDAADFVLGKFNKTEQKELPKFLTRAKEALDSIIKEGPDKAATKFN